ncbi:hypothetical protein CMV_002252 [Castanea mollissima]|uniref:Wall-associated receptor kinase galacturonan-binding domain-containing protein n=1 Tax=Castanea mollissima TaxID=60419 RepID=A0A8J4W3U2_9ROSI|nr:hypothetical protein CMV_002252 [Castanea mollissima]
MARGLTFTTVGLAVLIALVLVHPTCCAPTAMVNHTCSASSCGNIHNISFPFRLKTDPENCGDFSYNLSCENNRTVLYISRGKYYVQEISYNNYTIRIVDSGIHKDNYFSFSTPTHSSSRYDLNFHSPYYTYLQKGTKVNYGHLELSRSLVLMSCEKPVNSPLYLDTSTCNYNDNSSSISDSKRYRYVKVGRTNVSEVEESCKVEKMFRTSWPRSADSNIACKDVHNELVYGFELSWLYSICADYCPTYGCCYLNNKNHVQCEDDSIGMLDRIREWSYSYEEYNADWWYYLVQHRGWLYDGPDSGVADFWVNWVLTVQNIVFLHLATKIVLGTPCVVAVLICTHTQKLERCLKVLRTNWVKEAMALRKNFNQFVDHSSQIYFPTWVYGQFSEGNDIEMEDATEEEKKTTKKMIIVALWCIQMKPSDRPSMNKVVKMLEGEVESLQMPSKPFLTSSPGRPTGDVRDNLNSTSTSFQSGESSQLAKI